LPWLCSALAIGFAGWSTGGCLGGDPEGRELVARHPSSLYAYTPNYWRTVAGNAPGTDGQRVEINVCFESAGDTVPRPAGVSLTQLRGWVRDAVLQNWARYARINFIGWDTCQPGSQGIRILFQTGTSGQVQCFNPNNSTLGQCGTAGLMTASGRLINGVQNGMRVGNGCRGGLTCEESVRRLVIHEFGHALGFFHEEERPDFTGNRNRCQPSIALGAGSSGSTQYYGGQDNPSVMEHCAGQPSLSPGDIASIQKAYGRRIPGSLVSRSSFCLSAHAFSPGQTGAKPNLWHCDEFMDGQEWRVDTVSSLVVSPNLSPQSAAKLTGFTTPGTQVEIRDGTPSGGRWPVVRAKIRGFGGLCMDLWGGNVNGGPVRMFNCAGNPNSPGGNGFLPNQQWQVSASAFSSSGEIRFAGTPAKCLTVQSSNNGTVATVADCNGSAGQQFTMHGSGDIRVFGKCLNVEGPTEASWLGGAGGPTNGSAGGGVGDVNLWDCANVIAQKWNLSGPIVNALSGQCLDAGSEGHGLVPWTDTCNGLVFQEFDYYFKN
jgi:hypothetical protein